MVIVLSMIFLGNLFISYFFYIQNKQRFYLLRAQLLAAQFELIKSRMEIEIDGATQSTFIIKDVQSEAMKSDDKN